MNTEAEEIKALRKAIRLSEWMFFLFLINTIIYACLGYMYFQYELHRYLGQETRAIYGVHILLGLSSIIACIYGSIGQMNACRQFKHRLWYMFYLTGFLAATAYLNLFPSKAIILLPFVWVAVAFAHSRRKKS